MSISLFDAPIPGQSLTVEPKNSPWENPPMMSDPLDVFKVYMEQLSEEETLDDVMDMLDIGVPISVVSDTMLGMGVMEGIHSIDVSIIIAPGLHDYIHGAAIAEGIKVKERPITKDEQMEEKEKRVLANTLERSLEKSPEKDAGRELLEEALEFVQGDMQDPMGLPQEEDMPMDDMPMEEEKPMGLMARRGT